MSMEIRCDLSKMKIVGVDVGQNAVVVRDPSGIEIRVEVVAWPADDGEAARPNVSWEAVRRIVENHREDPELADQDEDQAVLPLRSRAR